jgi:CubicO group peptidase (beta-lactamase class C family)
MDLFKEKFEHETVKIMRDLKIPGISVYILKDNQPIYERAFGLRERGKHVKPATVDTLYGVSSITKSLVCFGILQLQDSGKLNIDDPISNHLPVDISQEGNPIRIKHLMSHASGVPSLMTFYFSQMSQLQYKAKAPEFPMGNWDDFYFHVNEAKSETLSPPETKYYYWNAGFVLLGQIIEKVSGIKFEDYITQNILQPLEMNRSTFSNKEAEKDDDTSRGFNFGNPKDQYRRDSRDLLSGPFIAAAGGLISSVKEFSNYLQCQMDGGEFKGKRLLSEELVKEMWISHNKNLPFEYSIYLPGMEPSYGYGWRIYDNFFGHKLITHGGMSGVSGGWVGFIPELNLSYVQLQNVHIIPLRLLLTAFTLLLGHDPEETLPYYKREKHFKLLSGKYEAYKKTITYEIESRHGNLFIKGDNWIEPFSTMLIPNNNDPEVMDFHVLTEYGKMNVPFTKHKDGTITFDWERHLMHKKTIELEE